jgi:raffinose/stachyose/melibiose transport system permease protein
MTTAVEAPKQARGGVAARRRRRGGGRVGYWPYLLPGGILFVGVILVPFVMNLYFSMTK